LPAGPQYHNHIGTVHAGALLSLAEAASAECLRRLWGPAEGVLPLVRRVDAKFRSPAKGVVTSSAECGTEAIERAHVELAKRGRTLLNIPVQLHDETGRLVVTATVEWFLQKSSA
jgi:acyl-coenzyme A thioesterase PaaI-like protein